MHVFRDTTKDGKRTCVATRKPIYIRSAQADDKMQIDSLIRQTGINRFGIDWRRFVVVEDRGKIVGMGQIKPHWDGTYELASLAVDQDYQGQGIGRVIVQALLANETRTLYLMCVRRMQVYYVFFGFRQIPPAMMPPSYRLIIHFLNTLLLLIGSRERVIVMKR